MKKQLLILFTFTSILASAQNYGLGIGIKSGYPGYGAINLKKNSSTDLAIDALFGFNFGSSGYLWAQCLFEKNKNIVNTSGVNWYYGAGPSAGIGMGGAYIGKNGNSYSSVWIAADGVIGIEYTLSSLPLNLALEGGLGFNIIPYQQLYGIGNVAIRYVVN